MNELLSSVGTEIAAGVIVKLVAKGYDKIFGDARNEYEKELAKIINETLDEFKKRDSGEIDGKTHFSNSQVIFDQLIQYRFTNDLDFDEIKTAIERDGEVNLPSEEELVNFLNVFSDKIANNDRLKSLSVEHNSKDTIAAIFEKLKSFDALSSTLQDFRAIGSVEDEWIRQLEVINKNIENFKPKTALEHLDLLQKHIEDKTTGNVDSRILGKIFFLKAICQSELKESTYGTSEGELFVKAYNLLPNHMEYKKRAAISYVVLGDAEKALKLTQEILSVDEYDDIAWTVKCACSENIIAFLKDVPATTFNKRQFKIQISFILFVRRIIDRIEELDTIGLSVPISDYEEPKSITYKNKSFWTLQTRFLINRYLQSSPSFSNTFKPLSDEEEKQLNYISSLLGKIIQAVEGSELEKDHSFFRFIFHYFQFILGKSVDVSRMEQAYRELEDKQYNDVFIMANVYSSLRNKEGFIKAIEVIDDFRGEGNVALSFLSALINLILEKRVEAGKAFQSYLDLLEVVDGMAVSNIIEYFERSGISDNQQIKVEIENVLNNKTFESEGLKDLLELVLRSHFKLEFPPDVNLIQKLDSAKEALNNSDQYLRYFLGRSMVDLNRFVEAIEYLETYVDTNSASDDLVLYCNALYHGEGNKPKLISILENCRKNLPPEKTLLRMEMEMRRQQGLWDKVVDICEVGTKTFPSDEYFILGLFTGFDFQMKTQEIQDNLHLIDGRQFKHIHIAIQIAEILSRASLKEKSIELLYSLAIDKNNKNARSAYFSSTQNYPEEMFTEHETVEIGHFVKYGKDDYTQIQQITNENKDKFPFNALIGKSVNDTFILKQGTSGTIEYGKIYRIMDKYLALFQEITDDIKNPLNDYPFEFIEIPANATLEEMNKKMMELFGVSGEATKEKISNVLNEYYVGKISFSEVTNAVFSRSFFDSYYNLTTKMFNFLRAVPPAVARNLPFEESTKFILDASSVFLMYELHKNCGIEYKDKFLISPFLRNGLIKCLEETRSMPKESMSLDITTQRVQPVKYPENFNERRIQKIADVLEWIDENCTYEDVQERLNITMQADDKKEKNLLIEMTVDNMLLTERGCVLLTNDIFYFTQFKASAERIVSPEVYLNFFSKDDMKKITAFMISCNYVGININHENLQDECVNMLSGKEHKFPNCLESLNYYWNPNPEHISQAVLFLKWLYLSPLFNNQSRRQIALSTLLSLFNGMEGKDMIALRDHIKSHFRLLGEKYDDIKNVFAQAFGTKLSF